METPPLHVLLALDAQILGGEVYDNTSPTPSVTDGDDLSTPSTTGQRRWRAQYTDANRKMRYIGRFDTQEEAAHAVNAAIRRAGLEGRRKTNPVVDGQLVPRARKARGHGPKALKRRREESAAAAQSTHARRPRRAVSYEEDPDFEL